MKKILITLFIFIFIVINTSFAYDDYGLRDYDGIEIPRGTFIPVISTQEISTATFDVGSKTKFISTNDLFLYETKVIPQETEFFGYIEKINEPIVGTNGSMIIKITKLKLPDGFEMPVRGYLYSSGGTLIGGEITQPASYDKKPSYRQGFKSMVGYTPGPQRRMGEHKVVPAGSDLMIILASPLLITHTVTN